MAKNQRKVWYGVTCKIHGIDGLIRSSGKWLKVNPQSLIKRIKNNYGCPKCKQEQELFEQGF